MSTLHEIATKFRTNKAAAKEQSRARAKSAKAEAAESKPAEKDMFSADRYRGEGLYFPAFKKNEQ